MDWNYERPQVPEGAHRIRVISAKVAKSKAGNDMLALRFDVSGITTILSHYITFLPDRPELTNRLLTQFFDSFPDIPCGNFDFSQWIGKMGACVVTKDRNNPARTRLYYFISAADQDDLEPWQYPPFRG